MDDLVRKMKAPLVAPATTPGQTPTPDPLTAPTPTQIPTAIPPDATIEIARARVKEEQDKVMKTLGDDAIS
jgi:hypothetical protein